MKSLSLFALTTRGLETVSKEELEGVKGFILGSSSYRRITGKYSGDPQQLLQLKTIDDLFIHIAEWRAVSHTRDMLARFEEHCSTFCFGDVLAACRAVRPVAVSPCFSVSASFVGKRNYSTEEIKQALSAGVSKVTGWEYSADDRLSDINLRIFIEHDIAIVGVRLAKQPLHERAYKIVQIPGSLKPPVAAAMHTLAETTAGDLLLDPFCGAGTILIEGKMRGAVARGGDINPDAVSATKSNGGDAIQVEQWDARSLPIADDSVSKVITNLPWDRQVALVQGAPVFYRDVCREIERVIRSNGSVTILTSMPELLHFDSLKLTRQIEISLFGQTPTISLFRHD